MQSKKDADAEIQKNLDKLCHYLLKTRSVHLERITPSEPQKERFCLAFDLPAKCPFAISAKMFNGLWIQVTMEPHYAFIANPVAWYAPDDILIIAPRRDREELDVLASIALERGGHPRKVILGIISKNVFRTFPVYPPH